MEKKKAIVKDTRWFGGVEFFLHVVKNPFFTKKQFEAEQIRLHVIGYKVHHIETEKGILMYKSHCATESYKEKMQKHYGPEIVSQYIKQGLPLRKPFYYKILNQSSDSSTNTKNS